MTIPPDEIMGQVHFANQSDKALATKGIDAWKYYRCKFYQGYNLAPKIAQPVNRSPASQTITISRDGAL